MLASGVSAQFDGVIRGVQGSLDARLALTLLAASWQPWEAAGSQGRLVQGVLCLKQPGHHGGIFQTVMGARCLLLQSK